MGVTGGGVRRPLDEILADLGNALADLESIIGPLPGRQLLQQPQQLSDVMQRSPDHS